MNTIHSPFSFFRAVLFVVSLALSAFTAVAAPTDAAVDKDRSSIVAVFALDGGLSEVPAGDTFSFGPPPSSLKEIVERFDKAANDPAVKAVVVLTDNAELTGAQVEELRAAMAS